MLDDQVLYVAVHSDNHNSWDTDVFAPTRITWSGAARLPGDRTHLVPYRRRPTSRRRSHRSGTTHYRPGGPSLKGGQLETALNHKPASVKLLVSPGLILW
jgi:hypothetical protein